MGCIETDSQTRPMADAVKNGRQMFDFVSQASPLPRRVFERNSYSGLPRGTEHFIQTGDDLFDGRRLSGAKMSAGMQDKEGQPKRLGKLKFLHERAKGLLAVIARLSAQINQITAVTKNRGKAAD